MADNIQRELGTIIAKLDAVHSDVREIKAEHKEWDNRIRSLEQSRARFRGISAALVFFSGAIGAAIAKVWK